MPINLTRRNLLAIAGVAAVQAQPRNDFHFALIGDRTGTAHPQIYSRVWREAALFEPDFAISIGDIIQGTVDATIDKEWAEIDTLLAKYKNIPLHYVPGNHDIWSPASEKAFVARAGHQPQYSFQHQNALFIILDNSRSEDLSTGQLDFCEAELRKHTKLKPKFILFHRPSWLVNIRVGNGDFRLHKLAVQYGVDYVFGGHGHQLVHLERDGVQYVEIGSSGGTIARGFQLGQGFKEGWFYHWMWIRVRGDRASVTVKEIGPGFGLGRTFPLSDWTSTGPKFDPGDPALIDSPKL